MSRIILIDEENFISRLERIRQQRVKETRRTVPDSTAYFQRMHDEVFENVSTGMLIHYVSAINKEEGFERLGSCCFF